MQNTFTSLLNRAVAMKGRLLLGVAGILCAIILAPLVASVLTPHTQGSVAPRRKFIAEENAACSVMFGCVTDYQSCEGSCAGGFSEHLEALGLGDLFECCEAGVEGGSCLYCE